MQPAESIPPLTKEGLRKLIGLNAFLGRTVYPGWSRYSVRIVDTEFINENEAIVRCHDQRDYLLSVLRFEGHVDDPMLVSMLKAKALCPTSR